MSNAGSPWKSLLQPKEGEDLILPWLGGDWVHSASRTWKLVDEPRPPYRCWGRFNVKSRRATFCAIQEDPSIEVFEGSPRTTGYLIGNLLLSDQTAEYIPRDREDPQPLRIQLVPPGRARFERAIVARDRMGNALYLEAAFPLGPEDAVQQAYELDQPDLTGIPHVSPALHRAFRIAVEQRALAQQRRAKLDAERQQRELLDQMQEQMGTAEGRRRLARDGGIEGFREAARSALRLTGATLLEVSPWGRHPQEMLVSYVLDGTRFECLAHRETLRIIDSGICLQDYRTGKVWDSELSLEALPEIIRDAGHRLHVYGVR